MFCQVRGKRDDVELHDVQELPKAEDIMKKGKFIPEMMGVVGWSEGAG